MDPRAKHEEEHEDSKKEREARTTSHCQPDINSIKAIKQRN
jgi:hypothetical protein